MGFFSWQEYWSGFSFPPPGDLPDPGIKPVSPEFPALVGRFCTTEPPGKPQTVLGGSVFVSFWESMAGTSDEYLSGQWDWGVEEWSSSGFRGWMLGGVSIHLARVWGQGLANGRLRKWCIKEDFWKDEKHSSRSMIVESDKHLLLLCLCNCYSFNAIASWLVNRKIMEFYVTKISI